MALILDPYIIKAVSGVTAEQIFHATRKLYPEYLVHKFEDEQPELDKWLEKLTSRPGLALSTGRRRSARGEYTCALLDVLGEERPKAVRSRMYLAWDVILSPVGQKNIGDAPELEKEKLAWKARSF